MAAIADLDVLQGNLTNSLAFAASRAALVMEHGAGFIAEIVYSKTSDAGCSKWAVQPASPGRTRSGLGPRGTDVYEDGAMKHVRYVAGLAVLVPGAMGAAAAPAAFAADTGHAANAVQQGAVKAKGKVTVNFTTCVPNNYFTIPSGAYLKSIHGWYSDPKVGYICVGRIVVDRIFIHKNCVYVTLYVAHGSTEDHGLAITRATASKVCANANSLRVVSAVFRQEFPVDSNGSIRAGVSSTYGNTSRPLL